MINRIADPELAAVIPQSSERRDDEDKIDCDTPSSGTDLDTFAFKGHGEEPGILSA